MLKKSTILSADIPAIEQAVAVLTEGGLVAFPTETVYGLGADASNEDAVAKIFRAKGRPSNHPLIVHIGSIDLLDEWSTAIPASAYKLAEMFWPGPLAMILPKQNKVPLAVTGGQQTVALRMPDNPVALKLLESFGGGIAAPSANRFKRISPTQAEHVAEELGDKVDIILNGGACKVGLESTIIDLSGTQPCILRPGFITATQIEAQLDAQVMTRSSSETRAPGMLAVHYAPVTPAIICTSEKIYARIDQLTSQNKKIAVLAHSIEMHESLYVTPLRLPLSAHLYAQHLYAALRELDSLQLDLIVVEKLPDNEVWRAVNDRLNKATVVDGFV